jgi:hypothetical protein
VDWVNSNHWTPLMVSALNGIDGREHFSGGGSRLMCMEKLIAAGANLNWKNSKVSLFK